MEVFVLVITGIVIAVLIVLLLALDRRHKDSTAVSRPVPAEHPEKSTSCPLCGASLTGGKRVKSVLYPGKPDSMMEIFGCPDCYPANRENERICPVCRKKVPDEGHVIARVFIKPDKKHVHVLGCSACYRRKS